MLPRVARLALLALSTSGWADPPPRSAALPERSPLPGPLFARVTPEASGVDLVHEFPVAAPFVHYQEQGAGAGVAIGDYDGDGFPDLFFSNYDRGCRLYRNLGGWKFADVTEAAGVGAPGRWAAGVTFVDIDNDGDLDLFVACYRSPSLLFLNHGDGRFEDRAQSLGLAWSGSSVAGAFADYDRDGRLDLYLLTHRDSSSPNQRLPSNTADALRRGTLVRDASGRLGISARDRGLFELIPKAEGRAELIIAGEADRLFHQHADGTFEDVTERSGIRGYDIGLSAAWWDYDADGWPDIYVANDHKSPDRLWRNQRDGTFREVTRDALPHVPFASMGTDLADINNDGWIDLLATEMAGSTRARRMMLTDGFEKNRWFYEGVEPKQYPRNALYLATGGTRVFEVAFLAGLAETDWTWSPKWGDFDNDGWVDLFVANGMSRDFLNADLLAQLSEPGSPGWRARSILRERNLAFRNEGGLTFVPRQTEWGLDQASASFGAALGDLDRDGDLDLVVMNLGEPPTLYENREARHHRLLVRLAGRSSNRFGVGTVVSAWTDRGRQARTITLGSGFMSSSEPLLHFGLGHHDAVPRLTIQWPSGQRQQFENLPADRVYTIPEPDPHTNATDSPAPTEWSPGFEVRPIPGFVHRHVFVDEFARETSLPWPLSRAGPCVALGDADGDGHDDFYLGGTPAQPGTIGIRDGNGTVRPTRPSPAAASSQVEDSAAVFFDANTDGHLDLYVASGGVASDPETDPLRDRLYLGNGQGVWREATAESLPEAREAASVVVAADFDRDGDLDLFVGGRSVPGRYPTPARSRLLRNDGGRFADVADALAPGLATTGIVTDAVWSDADNDGWIDLVLTREWGSLTLFRNQQGRFEDRTEASGLARHRGLWQGIAAGDVDGDGDIDYATANFGSNSRYKLADQGAIRLARGDFWDTGRTQLLETFLENGRYYPLRGRSTLLMEAPFLIARFPTFESMAQADLATLLGRDDDLGTASVDINTVESGLWINNGSAAFRFHPFPPLAQAAPTFAVGMADFDGDLAEDLLLAQNFRGAPLETGPMDGSLGLFLRGTGSGPMEPLSPTASGVVLPDESRAVAVTDRNDDGFPDALVSTHDGPLLELLNTAWARSPGVAPFTVRLRGGAGNPTAIGSRIDVRFQNGRRRVVEVHSRDGGGTARGSSHCFAHPVDNPPVSIAVRWPDGTTTTLMPPAGARTAYLEQTERPVSP